MPRIGGMFFSSAYLMVNHDKNEFSIASAQTTPAEAAVAGIDTANDCVAYLDGSILQTPSPDTTAGGSNQAKLSAGAIAGIVVGGVAGIALFAGIFFFLRRRKRAAAPPEPLGDAPADRAYVFEKDHSNVPEAPANTAVCKMSANERDYAVELDGTACPTELPVRQ